MAFGATPTPAASLRMLKASTPPSSTSARAAEMIRAWRTGSVCRAGVTLASVDQHVRAGMALGLAQRVVRGQRQGAVDDTLDVPLLVEVEVGAVDLEPDVGVVLHALQCVDGAG